MNATRSTARRKSAADIRETGDTKLSQYIPPISTSFQDMGSGMQHTLVIRSVAINFEGHFGLAFLCYGQDISARSFASNSIV